MDGVHIFLSIEEDKIMQFEDFICREAPPQSIITSIQHVEIPNRAYDDFKIIESHVQGIPDLLITPDFAICDQCGDELNDAKTSLANQAEQQGRGMATEATRSGPQC